MYSILGGSGVIKNIPDNTKVNGLSIKKILENFLIFDKD